MKRLELFEFAKEQAKIALDEHPYMLSLESIIRQLDYLIELELGARIDREKLSTIIIGRIAAYDIEALDMDLADLLHKVQHEVRMMLTRKW